MNTKSLFLFFRLVSFFVFISISLSAQQFPGQWNYHFPLDIETKVSGSFGEVRSNHFHSGLDLTTNGKSGWPVFAADTGFVSRIAVSPTGFGKAVYVDHPVGYTTVYAHLDRFPPRIDSLITALQYKNESFSVQHYFDEGEILVNRGELIGFTGNSGSSGGPHLHFEVRESQGQRPVDPLKFPNPVKDDIRPHIVGIMVYPLSDNASINNKSQPLFFPAVFYNGAFHLKHNPKISATGTIGLGIEVLDYYTGSWRKCGVYSINLTVNQQPLFNYTMEGFFFRDTRFVNSHIDYKEKIENRRTIQKSFIDPHNKINLYQVNSTRGEVTLVPGKNYRFAYTVEDISGNKSTLEFSISGDLINADKTITAASDDPVIDASQPFIYEEENHWVEFAEESFYRDVKAKIKVLESGKSLTGKVFSILDETIPVHKWFEIKIPVPDGIESSGLCGATLSENNKLEYAGGSMEGTHFVIRARNGGKYVLTRDTIPPEIRIQNKPFQMNYRGREKMEISIKDNFSGIDQYRVTINGEWTLFEYDAKNDRIICFLHKVPFLRKGEHELHVEISDQAGNKNQLETSFRY